MFVRYCLFLWLQQRTANGTFDFDKRPEVITPSSSFLGLSLVQVKISSSRCLSTPHGGLGLSPSLPTDGTLRHRVCVSKAHRAGAAIQGKPSALRHSFERASHTTSHGLQQKNVDFSQSFYSSVVGLDLIGSSPSYFTKPPIHSQFEVRDAVASWIPPINT